MKEKYEKEISMLKIKLLGREHYINEVLLHL